MNLNELPHDLLIKVLHYAAASTLIRAAMTCSWLKDAALEVAEDKISFAKDDPESLRPWEWTAQQALPVLFETELHWMLRRTSHDLHSDPKNASNIKISNELSL